MKKNKLVPIVLVSISIVLFIVSIILVSNSNYFKLNNNSNDKDSNSSQIKDVITENNNSNNKDDDNQKTEVDLNQNNNKNDEQEKVENNKQNQTNNSNQTNSSNSDKKQETPNTIIKDNSQQTSKDEIKKDPIDEVVNNSNSSNNDSNNQIVENNNSNSGDSNNVEETVTSESDVVTYFLTRENSINSSVDQDDRTFREKAKDAFVTVVDFIFYDKEIKGYTFDELTTSAKLKIIKIALSIDNKIDEYFPNYKETIKDKYTSIKGKLAVKYLEFTSTLCEKVGVDTCNQAKEDFNTMKESFGFTWEFIKELASNGSAKIKEFYESWRDSE